MDEKKIIKIIKEKVKKLQDLKFLIDKASKENNFKDLKKISSCFYENYDNLAFIGGLKRNFDLLKNLDKNAIDLSLLFLKTDPYFFRSGYIKEKIIHYLKKVNFDLYQKNLLNQILIQSVFYEKRREYIQYCLLASRIADEDFCCKIREIINNSNSILVKQQAEYMLKVILNNINSD